MTKTLVSKTRIVVNVLFFSSAHFTIRIRPFKKQWHRVGIPKSKWRKFDVIKSLSFFLMSVSDCLNCYIPIYNSSGFSVAELSTDDLGTRSFRSSSHPITGTCASIHFYVHQLIRSWTYAVPLRVCLVAINGHHATSPTHLVGPSDRCSWGVVVAHAVTRALCHRRAVHSGRDGVDNEC